MRVPAVCFFLLAMSSASGSVITRVIAGRAADGSTRKNYTQEHMQINPKKIILNNSYRGLPKKGAPFKNGVSWFIMTINENVNKSCVFVLHRYLCVRTSIT